jgi:hypothetical protein
MKYLVWFGGILIFIVTFVYVIAFTSVGNSLVKPIIQSKIKEQTKLDSKLNTFVLTMSEFEIVLELNENNVIAIDGKYSLFTKAFDVNYKVNLDNLKTLKPLTNVQLDKFFHISGTIKGDAAFMKIDGVSDLAQSNTTYHVELTDFNPTSIIANVKNLKLASLLDIGAQSNYASADVNLNINFKNINPHALDGDIVLETKNGTINPTLMKRDFNVTIPTTSFSMNLDAKLKGDDIDYSYELSSNLFQILSSGKVIPEPLKTDIKYSLNIKELEVLKPITKADIRGALRLSGTIKGDKQNLVIEGGSDLASSETKFEALLKEFAPVTLKATVKNLKLEKLLYMLKQPHYTDGVFSMSADINDVGGDKLKGKVVTTITEGILDSKYFTKAYEFKSQMPTTAFNSSTATILDGDIIDTKVDFNSNLVDLDIKSAKYSIKSASLKSDYTAKIENLDKFFFITDQHVKGAITVNGELSKAKDLDFSIHTKVAGGKIDAKLHNDDFHAQLNKIQTTELLHMLIYPELFESTINAKLDYNLAQSKGLFSGHVVNGVFAKNKTFDLIKQYVKFDMYRENFNGDVSAKINKEDILASVDFRSKEASVKTVNAKLNTKTKQIDADITVVAKKDSITANIKGDVDSPKVSVDLKKFIESETGKAVVKEVNKLFKKLFK